MKFEDFKKNIRQLTAANEIEDALDKMFNHVRTGVTIQDDITSLRGECSSINRAFRKGLISFEEFNRHQNRNRDGILSILKDILIQHYEEKPSLEKITAKLFVLTPTAESEKEMKKFFPFEYFREVEFVLDETYQQAVQAYDLVIFDNYPHPGVEIEVVFRETQIQKLQWLIDSTDCYIVWFGGSG